MMVKAKDGSSWVLFDYVSNIRHRYVESIEELRYCRAITDKDFTDVEFSKKEKTVFVTLSSKSLDKSLKFIAFSPVYILNDQGQTVDKV